MVLAVGDIADCGRTTDDEVAALLIQTPGIVVTLGDNAYPKGSTADYRDCFDPPFGPLTSRMKPAPGNHDYDFYAGVPYFDYFGAVAGDRAQGWYSYDVGSWHIVALNSNCAHVGGCEAGSPQEQWLRADLAAHPAVCTLAYWHHPVFSSGQHGSNTKAAGLFQALYDFHADVVLNGHDHIYERFAPQDPAGVADPIRGIREFVVGTGGQGLYRFGTIKANSEVRDNTRFGALKLTLMPTGYDWEFLPSTGGTAVDSGAGTCAA